MKQWPNYYFTFLALQSEVGRLAQDLLVNASLHNGLLPASVHLQVDKMRELLEQFEMLYTSQWTLENFYMQH